MRKDSERRETRRVRWTRDRSRRTTVSGENRVEFSSKRFDLVRDSQAVNFRLSKNGRQTSRARLTVMLLSSHWPFWTKLGMHTYPDTRNRFPFSIFAERSPRQCYDLLKIANFRTFLTCILPCDLMELAESRNNNCAAQWIACSPLMAVHAGSILFLSISLLLFLSSVFVMKFIGCTRRYALATNRDRCSI